MKDAFSPFGAGSRSRFPTTRENATHADPIACIGIHLAMLELLLGAFIFFKQIPEAELSPKTTDESMGFENYFLIAPKSHCCEIRMRHCQTI